jgi:uncharacterized protein (DUF1697 family)
MEKFVALLRGINVGGHKKVPMKELKSTLEKAGYKNVKTLLASGNVVLEGKMEWTDNLPDILEKKFGFPVGITVIPFQRITAIVRSDPFGTIDKAPETRLYVTFLGKRKKSDLEIPYESEDGSFRIIGQTDLAVYSVLNVEKIKTTDAMVILDREFGKDITTRNYNTVVKIAGM